MPVVQNNAEGGTDTTDVTTGNSGGVSGDAFNLVQIPASGNVKFSATQEMHGSLAYQLATRGTAGNMGVLWSNAAILATTLFSRFYFFFTALPGVTNPRMQAFFDQTFSVEYGSFGIVTGTNTLRTTGAGATLVTGTSTVSANTWYRAECKVTLGTPGAGSNATIEVRWFLGDDTAPIEVLGPSTFTATASITAICPGRFGCGSLANYPTSTDFVYYDGLGASTVNWIGSGASVADFGWRPNKNPQSY